MTDDLLCGDLEEFTKALQLADEIERNWADVAARDWGYQWEHLGDAERDIRVLIAGLRDADDAMGSMIPIEQA